MENDQDIGKDRYMMDGHKLLYHLDRLRSWLEGKLIYPIYLEVGVTARCNQRCIFCAFDFLNSQGNELELSAIKKFVQEAGEKGVRSILYAGEGEPLLHPELVEVVKATKEAGIDVAITTNALLLDENKAKEILSYLSWLRISLDAGDRKTYAYLHSTAEENYDLVLENIRNALEIKKRENLDLTLGIQFLLLPQNLKEVIPAVKIAAQLGVDYFVVKPYSQHPFSLNRLSFSLESERISQLERELKEYEREGFQVIFRKNALSFLKEEKPYQECLGLDFATYLSAEGDVYPCSNFIGKKDFSFGNINRQSFQEIWEGKRRQEVKDRISRSWASINCRKACRLDSINRFLRELKEPPPHVNFI